MPQSSAPSKCIRALLNEPLKGTLYLATPHQNPSGSLLAGYIAVEGSGDQDQVPGNSKPTR